MLGSEELLLSPEYEAAKAEGRHMSLIYAEIARKTPAKTSAEWLAIFAANDIPAMVARDLEDIRDDPHLTATGFFRRREHPDVAGYVEMRPPVRYGAATEGDLGFAPRIDGDGAAIRAELAARRN